MKRIIALAIALSCVAVYSVTAFAAPWQQKDAEVIIDDKGDNGGAGVQAIEYSLNGSAWQQYNGKFVIKNDGLTEVRVRAIDTAGNISELGTDTAKIDRTAPTAGISASTTEWTNQNVLLTVNAADTLSGVAKIINPAGQQAATYTAEQNGTYSFVVIDAVGNSSTVTITLNNIEKEVKPLKVEVKDEWINTPNTVTLPPQDEIALSGVHKFQYRVESEDGIPIGASSVSNENSNSVLKTVSNAVSNILNAVKDFFVTTAFAADTTNDGWKDYTSGVTVTDEGRWIVKFRAISNAGNVTPVAGIEIKNDYTPPTAEFKQNGSKVNILAADNLSGVQSILLPDGKKIEGTTAEFKPAVSGSYVVEVVDNAGNSTTYSVDVTLPSSDGGGGGPVADNSNNDDSDSSTPPASSSSSQAPPEKPKPFNFIKLPGKKSPIAITPAGEATTVGISSSDKAISDNIVSQAKTFDWKIIVIIVLILLLLLLIILFIAYIIYLKKDDDEDEEEDQEGSDQNE